MYVMYAICQTTALRTKYISFAEKIYISSEIEGQT
jgi:hypothetical protein